MFRCARWDVITAYAGSRQSAWTVTDVDERGLGLVPHDLTGLARTGRGLSELFAPTAGHSLFLKSPTGQEALFDCVGESGDTALLAPHGLIIERADDEAARV